MTIDPRLLWKTRLFTAVVVLSSALGNFALGWGMKQVPAVGVSPIAYVHAIFSPWVLAGITLLILWTLARLAMLSWADLTYVLPVTSLGYVATALMGKFFLAEEISTARWLGTILIVAGMVLVSRTRPDTTQPRGHRE